ncbi:MAG: hypothetical protein V7691_14605 [Galbibacter orientalis]|jgi:hypothetical protein|uniref:hypothetical protein n=1 Tax=Galbibacter orientalis TaxID=453852 RepID=UPI003002A9A4
MAFKNGHEKVGGRQKGSTNLITKELRKDLKEIVYNELQELPERLESLSDERRLEVLFKMMPYVFPKVNPISSTSGEPISFDFDEF